MIVEDRIIRLRENEYIITPENTISKDIKVQCCGQDVKNVIGIIILNQG